MKKRRGVSTRSKADSRIDPVTLQVLRNSFETACQEAGITLMRSSYTPMVKEGADFGAAIFDGNGEMIASAGFVMAHNVSMPFSVKALLGEYDHGEMHDGDVFITNDPYIGSNHLPDVTLMTPCFEKGEVVAFSANRTHWADVGGMFAGSMSGTGTEIYQEGVRIPALRIVSRGRMNDEVLRLMMANMRVPEDREGDLRAQISANNAGIRKFSQIVKKYGKGMTLRYAEALKDYAEELTRNEISSTIPEGKYESVEFMDNDGVVLDRLVKLRLSLSVKGSNLVADFTGSDSQSLGAANLTYPNTVAALIEAMRFLFPPYIPLNEGSFRPVTIIAPEGTLVNPRFPAATALGPTGLLKIIRWAYFAALAPVIPEKIAASEYNATGDFIASGRDSMRNRPYVLYTLWEGGSGGALGTDGMHAIRHGVGALMNTPVEVLEAEYPLMVEKVALRQDSDGAGRFRGGAGVVRRYRALDNVSWSIATEKNRIGPWGLFGGKSGARSDVRVERPEKGETISISKMGGKVGKIALAKGDVLVLMSPGGGGFGDPLSRNPDYVSRDCKEGYISIERAKEEYGVVVDPQTFRVDEGMTKELRDELDSRRSGRLEVFSYGVEIPEVNEINEKARRAIGDARFHYLSTGKNFAS